MQRLIHLCPVDSSTGLLGQVFFPIEGVSCLVLTLPFIIEIPVYNANSATLIRRRVLRCLLLGLHCLLISLLLDARHKWVNKSVMYTPI